MLGPKQTVSSSNTEGSDFFRAGELGIPEGTPTLDHVAIWVLLEICPLIVVNLLLQLGKVALCGATQWKHAVWVWESVWCDWSARWCNGSTQCGCGSQFGVVSRRGGAMGHGVVVWSGAMVRWGTE